MGKEKNRLAPARGGRQPDTQYAPAQEFWEIQGVTELLLASDDDMVQKGLGWLLREAAKANPDETVAYLMAIRDRTPRLVLRTACETLPLAKRQQLLAKQKSSTTDTHR